MTDHTCTVIDTPEGIALVRFLAVRSALAIEVKTGMKMSRGGSPLKVANQLLGTSFRVKKDALRAMNEVLADFDAGAPEHQHLYSVD